MHLGGTGRLPKHLGSCHPCGRHHVPDASLTQLQTLQPFGNTSLSLSLSLSVTLSFKYNESLKNKDDKAKAKSEDDKLCGKVTGMGVGGMSVTVPHNCLECQIHLL